MSIDYVAYMHVHIYQAASLFLMLAATCHNRACAQMLIELCCFIIIDSAVPPLWQIHLRHALDVNIEIF